MDSLAFVLAVAAGAAVAWAASRRSAGSARAAAVELDRRLAALGQRLDADAARVAARLEAIDTRMLAGQSSTAEIARAISDRLADVHRATASVAEQAREFGALQDMLRPPNARGGLGEAMLEELLSRLLPPGSFAFQHRFSSGVVVDAIVRAGGGVVCIDSKFPLANFRRMCDAAGDRERSEAERAFAADVSRHIDAIRSRYIVPDEGTFDFAVMYVPAEGVYGEVLRLCHRKRPLYETAIEARVVPMSPLTMVGYLQTILFGLKCLRIEKGAHEILGRVRALEQAVELFASDYETMGRHLTHARLKYEDGARRLERLGDKLGQVADLVDDDGAEARPSLEAVSE